MAHGVLKKLTPALLLLVLSVAAGAQQDSVENKIDRFSFHVIANGGLLAGANGREVQVQLVPGVQYKGWFAGVGSGLDYYYWRGVPLFLDVHKLFQSTIPVFLYSVVGLHFPWVTDTYKTTSWYTVDFKTGLYYDVGAGWYAKIRQSHALLLSVGYSGKKVRSIQKELSIPPGVDERFYTTRYAYNLQRISIKVGFQF